jgi:hypothetical protein
MINNGHKIMIAQSGNEQFMFMRTKTTVASADFNSVNNNNYMRIGQLTASGQNFNTASQQAAKETANRYGLAYYEGTNGLFKKVQ